MHDDESLRLRSDLWQMSALMVLALIQVTPDDITIGWFSFGKGDPFLVCIAIYMGSISHRFWKQAVERDKARWVNERQG